MGNFIPYFIKAPKSTVVETVVDSQVVEWLCCVENWSKRQVNNHVDNSNRYYYKRVRFTWESEELFSAHWHICHYIIPQPLSACLVVGLQHGATDIPECSLKSFFSQ